MNIDPDSEFGKALSKLDSVYVEINSITNKISYLKKKKEQLIEDVDVMELLLMHKLNKDSRNAGGF
jgi:uncharacterized lipoprotein YehR (DUF1307 family)